MGFEIKWMLSLITFSTTVTSLKLLANQASCSYPSSSQLTAVKLWVALTSHLSLFLLCYLDKWSLLALLVFKPKKFCLILSSWKTLLFMPITTRFQFEQGNHPPFNYTQLPPPTRRSWAPVSEDSSSFDKSEESKDSKVTPWYKGGFLFFAFKTPKSTDIVVLTLTEEEKYHHLQEHFERRDNQARLDKEYSKNLMAERMNSRDFS